MNNYLVTVYVHGPDFMYKKVVTANDGFEAMALCRDGYESGEYYLLLPTNS